MRSFARRQERQSIREWLNGFFDGLSHNQRSLDDIPSNARDLYLRVRTLPFGMQMFSDTIVIYLPMFPDERVGFARPAVSLWSALLAVANVMLTALAAGIPLRAGMDIGNGLDVSDHEVYGAVSVRAYRLESTVAQYPRAVVGDGLLRYLAFLENQQDPLVVEHGTACRNLLCTAPDDGIYMLHLLAPEVLASGPHHHELPHRALAWITRELHAHRSANNHRLTERYTRLLTYFAANGYAVTSEGASSQQGL